MKLLLLALLLTAAALKSSAQDMVIYDGALQSGWQKRGWAAINYANPAPVHSGTASICVTDTTSKYQALYLAHAPLNPAPYQALSFWIYPTLSGSSQLHVEATLDGSPRTSVPLSFTPDQVNHWQHETIPISSLHIANNPAFNGFWIQNITRAPITFYVDDVSLIAIPAPTQVQLTVNPQSAIRTIDPRIYGINLAIWDSHLASPDTASALASMGIGALRFPGGSSSDDYDWQTNRSPSRQYQFPNNAATFAKVIEAQSAQAFVTVNYGSGTPQQAAAWVAYYNASASGTAAIGIDSMGRDWKTAGFWASLRAASPLPADDGCNFLRISHPAPFAFKYWEIGNECYGKWENDLHGAAGSGLTGAPHDAYTYAVAFQSYYNQMRAVDPTIHIGAVAPAGENAYGNHTRSVPNPNEANATHSGWTPLLLATLKSLGVTPHFLVYHTYAQEPGDESDAFLLQAGAKLQSDAPDLRKMITDYFGSSGTSIELDMTELNSVSSNPGKQSTSLVNALFMADALGNLASTEFNTCIWWDLRNGGGGQQNNNPLLYGWRQYGDYGVLSSRNNFGHPATFPNFYAEKLLTHWGRGGDTVVSATSSYILLSIYAAKLADGGLSLLVINKNPVTDLPARINLNNFTPASSTVATYTYGKQNDQSESDITPGSATISGSTINYTFPSYSITVLEVKVGP